MRERPLRQSGILGFSAEEHGLNNYSNEGQKRKDSSDDVKRSHEWEHEVSRKIYYDVYRYKRPSSRPHMKFLARLQLVSRVLYNK